MNKIVKMIFGSHLYGTNTSQSDHDYKGVFLPSAREICLQRVPKSIHETTKQGEGKNSPDDVEHEFYSLHHFLHLACEGETVALDMLHAPESATTVYSYIWEDLVSKRKMFYTKNLRAFVGYARKQAAKYGVKGSRLAEAKMVLEWFKLQGRAKLIDVWDQLPTGEHIHKTKNDVGDLYVVCGKAMTPLSYCFHYVEMLEAFVNNYGARARQAEANEGIDWKAVSHAFRAGYQVMHILLDGGYTYPLPETEYLIKVKTGQLHFANEVGPMLELLMENLERATQASTLPNQVDQAYWDTWLEETIYDSVFG